MIIQSTLGNVNYFILVTKLKQT